MTVQTPGFLQAGSYPADILRRMFSTLVPAAGGIVSPTDLAVTALGTPNMTVNIAAGQAWIPGTQGAATGMPTGQTSAGDYYAYNDGVLNRSVTAANPTNPRIDLVVLQIFDAEYGGSSSTGDVVVVTGTAGAIPAVPAAPANSLVLAQLSIAASQATVTTASITDVRPVARGPAALTLGTNVTLFGGGYSPAHALQSAGRVHVEGAFNATAAIAAAAVVARLPPGIPAPSSIKGLSGSFGAAAGMARFDVHPDGTITTGSALAASYFAFFGDYILGV